MGSDLTADELEALTRSAATQLSQTSPLLSVHVLRLISEVQRRRINERACTSCGTPR